MDQFSQIAYKDKTVVVLIPVQDNTLAFVTDIRQSETVSPSKDTTDVTTVTLL